MKVMFLLLVLILSNLYTALAQCDKSLVEKAFQQSGENTVLMKDFKIKYTKGKRNRPAQVAKYEVYLQANVLYRFDVANAAGYEGKAIMQLYQQNNLLGSTFDLKKHTDTQRFDFLCEHTGDYQVWMSFDQSKEGCAAGVLSLVITDSTHIPANEKTATREMDILYIGVDNPLSLDMSNYPGGNVDVKISEGKIEKYDEGYIARVEKEGRVTITVVVRDSTGKIKEAGSSDFLVRPYPEPCISIAHHNGGYISKQDVLTAGEIAVQDIFDKNKWEIIEFTIAQDLNMIDVHRSKTNKFTDQQKKFIEKMDSGTKLYIKNIVVRKENETKKLNPVEFIIE